MERAILTALLLSTALPVHAAEIQTFHGDDGSSAIFIGGEIGSNDADQFKIKAGPLSGKTSVVLNSPGGNLIAALQIGEMIRLRGWSTYVISECYSGCALIWLAGVQRVMTPSAKIGFHASSVNGQEKGLGNALVGAYLNRLGYSYEVVGFATIASPDDISLLTPETARKIGIDVVVREPTPVTPTEQPTFRPQQQTAVPKYDPVSTRIQAENEAAFVVAYLYSNAYTNDVRWFQDLYWDSASYFGKITSKSDILADKQKYFERWPNRSYKISNATPPKCTAVEGDVLECLVAGTVTWEVSNASKKSVGSATYEYKLRPWPLGSWNFSAGFQVQLRIASENGTILNRQITDVPKSSMTDELCRKYPWACPKN